MPLRHEKSASRLEMKENTLLNQGNYQLGSSRQTFNNINKVKHSHEDQQ